MLALSNILSYGCCCSQTSLIRWAYEALCVNEFSGLVLKPEAKYGPKSVSAGEQVLDSMGMGQSTIKGAVKAQVAIILVNYAFTFFSLLRQRPSFESVKPPHKSNKDNHTSKNIKKIKEAKEEGGEDEEDVSDGEVVVVQGLAAKNKGSSSASTVKTPTAPPKPPVSSSRG